MLRLIFVSITTAWALWPKPSSVSLGTQRVTLNPDTYRFQKTISSLELDTAFERYPSIFFPHLTKGSGSTAGLVVEVKDATAPLKLGADESYTLEVRSDGWAVVSAQTVWGALHGIETMAQLVDFNFSSGEYSVSGAPLLIKDVPRFSHRGLLIDSGRHFEPVKQIKALIESMTYAKLNVLHWHLTEDESFPLASRVHPELPRLGAWDAQEQYTWRDLQDIVEYARLRGIRVVPEFDMPGHTSSWRKSHPELFALGCSGKERGAFDPAENRTFDFLEATLKDWSEVFIDDFQHLGSDEVPSNCWNNSKDLAWMKTMGFSNSSDVFNYFVNRMIGINKQLGRETILWDEAFLSAKPPKEAVIQNWHDETLMKKIVDAGYRGIFSSSGSYTHGWYLDAVASSWDRMYVLDPMTNISEDKAPLLLGGEGAMWGEHVDPSDLELTVWPRLAAIAERLWSAREVNSTAEALPRLQVFRCRLLERGVRSGVVGGEARSLPPGPGSCSQVIQPKAAEEILV